MDYIRELGGEGIKGYGWVTDIDGRVPCGRVDLKVLAGSWVKWMIVCWGDVGDDDGVCGDFDGVL